MARVRLSYRSRARVAENSLQALSAEDAPHLQPGRAAEMLSGGDVIGWVGELHPLAVAAYDAEGPVVAFELDMAALERNARPARDYVDVLSSRASSAMPRSSWTRP